MAPGVGVPVKAGPVAVVLETTVDVTSVVEVRIELDSVGMTLDVSSIEVRVGAAGMTLDVGSIEVMVDVEDDILTERLALSGNDRDLKMLYDF